MAKNRFKLRDISAAIQDDKSKLEIDDCIRQLVGDKKNGFLPAWRNKPDKTQQLGRKILEAAWQAAKLAQASIDDKPKEDWKQLSSAAQNSLLAVALLLKALRAISSLKRRSPSLNAKKNIENSVFDSISFFHAWTSGVRGRRLKDVELRNLSQMDTQCVNRFRELMNLIVSEADKQSSLFALGEKNPGLPEKRAFARCCMEGWFVLTNIWPSESNKRFVGFLTTAWSDVCDAETDWRQPIRSLAKAKTPLWKRYINQLKSGGPDWLDP